MALKATFPDDIIKKASERGIAMIEESIVEKLSIIGEHGVNFARNQERDGAWKDDSGNLRSSIGYVIFRYGQSLFDFGFEGAGPEGPARGKALAMQVGLQYRDSWFVLVIVAGMAYAVDVESRGRDVLSGASLQAEKSITQALEQLTKNLRSSTGWMQ